MTRLSAKAKAAMALALALILWAPQGISTETQPVVTGHSTFYNGDVFDQCLASIAGILRSRVMWFNDMVLTESYPGRGTFVYMTQHGGLDPSKATALYSEGVFFDFVDPNGAHWRVEEVYLDLGTELGTKVPGGSYTAGDTIVEAKTTKQYVWIVELAERPIFDRFAPSDIVDPNYHTFYNFLVLVDTCKFTNKPQSQRANETHTGAELGHESTDGAHEHESYKADLWVGKRPNIIVPDPRAGTSSAQWTSSWALS